MHHELFSFPCYLTKFAILTVDFFRMKYLLDFLLFVTFLFLLLLGLQFNYFDIVWGKRNFDVIWGWPFFLWKISDQIYLLNFRRCSLGWFYGFLIFYLVSMAIMILSLFFLCDNLFMVNLNLFFKVNLRFIVRSCIINTFVRNKSSIRVDFVTFIVVFLFVFPLFFNIDIFHLFLFCILIVMFPFGFPISFILNIMIWKLSFF